MTKGEMTASKLRLILSIMMLLALVSASVSFYFAQSKLKEYAVTISQLNATAQNGNDNLQTLQNLQKRLEDERETMTKARSIVAQSQQYLYQDQIVQDLSRIAGDNGVVITQFDFASTTSAVGGGEAALAALPSDTETTSPVPAVPTSSLKSQTVNVTIKSPLPYDNLMNFIKAIELNPMKMQIAAISLAKDTGNNVSSQAFTIEVYVR